MDKFDILINIYLFTYSVECSDGQSFVQTYINWLNKQTIHCWKHVYTYSYPVDRFVHVYVCVCVCEWNKQDNNQMKQEVNWWNIEDTNRSPCLVQFPEVIELDRNSLWWSPSSWWSMFQHLTQLQFQEKDSKIYQYTLVHFPKKTRKSPI